MADLKPCPFCGCAMRVESSRDWHRPVGNHDDSCMLLDEDFVYPADNAGLAELVEDWNRRATDGQREGVPEGYTAVRTETLNWLLGESGDFECPPEQYFRGKPAPYFWRKGLRAAMLAAAPTPDIGMTISPTPPAQCKAGIYQDCGNDFGCAGCPETDGEAGQERDRRDAKRYRYLRDECDLSVRDVFGSWCPHLNDGMDIAIDAAIAASKPQCDCLTCIRERGDTIDGLPRELCEMIVCTTCGNKRCPKANDHRNACTGSNEPGQPGSAYPAIEASKGEKG